MKYIAKPDTWFDEGTEVKLVADYRIVLGGGYGLGLFEGLHEGEVDQESCSFEEFEIKI